MQEQNGTYRLIISGGGTGGHIYPAIAIADAFKRRFPDSKILFVGARGKMEMEKVPQAGYEIIGLWISGIQRKMTIQNLYFPFKLISSYFTARRIIRRYKPHAVVGVGGYASGPIMIAAIKLKVPAVIQEQNSFAGLTNRKLGNKVQKICVAYEGMEKYFPEEKIVITGNPVRTDILSLEDKKSLAISHFKLSSTKKTILVIGGSLGARTINNSVVNGLDKIVQSGVQIIWQTGKFYYEEMKAKAVGYGEIDVHIHQFIREMDLAYAAADLVVSRAGALSVSELCLARKATILVPSPNVAEDHQTKNAMALVEKEAAVMVKDEEAPDLLIEKALELIKEEERRGELSKRIGQMGKPDAAKDIVTEIETLIP